MDSRARRIVENEVLCREANTQMRWLDEKLCAASGTRYDFLCECGDDGCFDHITLSVEEYERVHADPTQFTIVEGHEIPTVEDIVERHRTFAVVRKRGDSAEFAAEHPPI
jgi:hypothetical protein